MADFDSLLRSIAKRPGMYVGTCSIHRVGLYLSGYDHGFGDAGRDEPPLEGWGRWLESRFLISHPAWHWTRILLHSYGSDRAAIESLPDLYQEFAISRAAIGVEGIEAEHRRRFFTTYGQDCREPTETSTTWE